MNFAELSLNRESTRKYIDKSISHDDIDEIINEAIRCPSACNSQPWKFVVCDKDLALTISDCILGKDIGINKWTEQVPAFVIVCETKAKLMSSLNFHSQHFAQIDLGAVTTSLCYAAADKGIGSCIIGCFDEKKIKSILEIPDDISIRLVVALGYSDNDARNKTRKNIDEIRSYNKW